jgi:hypothetical protein
VDIALKGSVFYDFYRIGKKKLFWMKTGRNFYVAERSSSIWVIEVSYNAFIMKTDKILPYSQLFYYLLTAIWPFVHLESFFAVTGPKPIYGL